MAAGKASDPAQRPSGVLRGPRGGQLGDGNWKKNEVLVRFNQSQFAGLKITICYFCLSSGFGDLIPNYKGLFQLQEWESFLGAVIFYAYLTNGITIIFMNIILIRMEVNRLWFTIKTKLGIVWSEQIKIVNIYIHCYCFHNVNTVPFVFLFNKNSVLYYKQFQFEKPRSSSNSPRHIKHLNSNANYPCEMFIQQKVTTTSKFECQNMPMLSIISQTIPKSRLYLCSCVQTSDSAWWVPLKHWKKKTMTLMSPILMHHGSRVKELY